MTDYRVIRSNRKTLAIQITPEGVVVRAPYLLSDAEIARQVAAHEDWIRRHTAGAGERRDTQGDPGKLTPAQLQALAQRAAEYIPARVRYFAPRMGVTYGRVTIRSQHTRWGSCSSKGNLNFNCLLMLAPPEVIDSVVVHELAHRKEMNHSERFYAEVLRVYPRYHEYNGWLKKHGAELMRRLP